MTIPYEQTGRRNQKARTCEALVAAARELLATGVTPTVEEAAAHAAVSRGSLLPEPPPADPVERLALVVAETTRIVLDWEPQLRASLRLSLEPGQEPTGPVLRRGRVIGWLEDALAPLAE